MGTVLGIHASGKEFTLNGQSTFLLGASYFAALGASDDFVDADLHDLREHGFNWIRVWSRWAFADNDVSAIDPDGEPREPYLSRLVRLCGKVDALGMAMDVTLMRGDPIGAMPTLHGLDGYSAGAACLARELKPFRNVYFDLGNESDSKMPRTVSFEDLRTLREKVKDEDPERLTTTSQRSDIDRQELESLLLTAEEDFICPHRPREPESPAQTAEKTREYHSWMQELGRTVPVHYQEPLRRGWNYDFQAEAFLADLRGAVAGGAAGWCFHNGHNKLSEDGRPYRSFDMRPGEGRLFDQLDSIQRTITQQAAGEVAGCRNA